MANSIRDIYNQIIEEKDNFQNLSELSYEKSAEVTHADALLTDLNSGSKVSIWRLWAYVTAVVIFFHEKMWDLFKAEVETKLQAMPGTPTWLAQECRKFQYPDQLTVNSDGTYGYDTIDEDKQIIKRVAVTDSLGNAVVKVATEDGDGLSALSSEQKDAFAAYVGLIQYAGTTVNVVSGESDKMKLEMVIYYDALVPKSQVSDNVEAAIQNYLSNLAFDGTFKVIKLVDAIQKAKGVKDVSDLNIEAKSDSGTFLPVSRVYNPASGYIEIDNMEELRNNLEYRAE